MDVFEQSSVLHNYYVLFEDEKARIDSTDMLRAAQHLMTFVPDYAGQPRRPRRPLPHP